MLIAEARVQTDRPSRYLVQLCRHAAAMPAIHSRRPRTRTGGDASARHEVQLHAEWSDTQGTVTFAPWGRCTMQVSRTMLMLRVEATDEEHLRRCQEVVTRNLERFGRRDHLTVTWQQPAAPAAWPGDADPTDRPRPEHPAETALARRGRHTTMVLTTAGTLGIALAVALHLGLGAAMQAASRWLGWTAVGLAVVPVVAVLGHAVVPVTILALHRLTTQWKANNTHPHNHGQHS